MKSSVAIALIICGTVLVLGPLIIDAVRTGIAAWARVMTGTSTEAGLTRSVPRAYSAVCILIGLAMILTGILSGFKSRPS